MYATEFKWNFWTLFWKFEFQSAILDLPLPACSINFIVWTAAYICQQITAVFAKRLKNFTELLVNEAQVWINM